MTLGFGPERERFRHSLFIILVNRLVAVAVAAAALSLLGKSLQPGAPLALFAVPSVANVLGSASQYEALKYVSFPLQALAKCAKTVSGRRPRWLLRCRGRCGARGRLSTPPRLRLRCCGLLGRVGSCAAQRARTNRAGCRQTCNMCLACAVLATAAIGTHPACCQAAPAVPPATRPPPLNLPPTPPLSRQVPVMAWGLLLGGRRYDTVDYGCALTGARQPAASMHRWPAQACRATARGDCTALHSMRLFLPHTTTPLCQTQSPLGARCLCSPAASRPPSSCTRETRRARWRRQRRRAAAAAATPAPWRRRWRGRWRDPPSLLGGWRTAYFCWALSCCLTGSPPPPKTSCLRSTTCTAAASCCGCRCGRRASGGCPAVQPASGQRQARSQLEAQQPDTTAAACD